jgi:hypothetical protein
MKIDWKKEIKFSSLSGISRPKLRGRGQALNSDESKAEAAPKSPRSKPGFEAPAFLSGVKAPKIVTDLYVDLRDRRLLPLVAVLLVAIVAAPILLGNTSESEPEAAPVVGSPGTQRDASFEVVPAEAGLRDYHKRLGHRQARDPFAQPGGGSSKSEASQEGPSATASKTASAPTAGSDGAAEGSPPAEESASVSSPEASGGSGGESPGSVNTPGPGETGTGGGDEGGPGGSGGGSEGSGSTGGEAPAPRGEEVAKEERPAKESGASHPPTSASTTTVVEKNVTGYAIAAKTMLVGKDKEANAVTVKEMGKLPDPKQPVAIYLGVSEDKKGALFLLGDTVTAYYGHGRCTLDKQSCTVLELRPGKSATLAFGVEEQRYKITLDAIEPEVETNEVATTSVEAAPSR